MAFQEIDEKSGIETARVEIMDSLLSVRGYPYSSLERLLGMDEGNGTLRSGTTLQALFPLLENQVLDDAAQAICVASVSYDLNATSDNNIMDYLAGLGYRAEKIHLDKTGLIMQEYIDPEEGGQLLLKTYLQANLEQADDNTSAIFNNDYLEIGVGFCGGIAKLPASEPANLYMMVILLARPEGPQPNWIQCGHVFYDVNNNHVFDEGEGLEAVKMTDDNGTLLTTTLTDGQYCFRRPLGEWTLYLEGYPFSQDYNVYNILLGQRKDGVLYQDIPFLLTQDQIYVYNENEIEK